MRCESWKVRRRNFEHLTRAEPFLIKFSTRLMRMILDAVVSRRRAANEICAVARAHIQLIIPICTGALGEREGLQN